MFIAIIIMVGIQYFMSTRNSAFLGIIVPIAFITVMTWMFVTNQINSFLKFAVLLIVGLLFLLEEWVRGRKSLSKKRDNELNKMKSSDLK
ncbi:hypothetical protein AAV35_013970 (plasmid) [Salimicrobium jeotgali]|nr:hypothetical protein AAV35_013970 [Salimicrobium jeotgali]